jgi:hypothetical protein
MLPEHDVRLKTTAQFENWDKFTLNVKNGYYKQFSRNTLQLNNGNGTFSEISRLAGVQATDWSWGALIFDMDNDGLKDIFVANGIYKELLNQDYVNFASNPQIIRDILDKRKGIIIQLIDSMPSTAIQNFAFKNRDNLSFENKAEDWGFEQPTFSNGSAYGDLDNDGDLDLVLNNVNMPSFIYENQSKQLHPENATLSFVLHGDQYNSFAIGTKITLKIGDQLLYNEVSPMRGFMSTVDNRVHIGLGKVTSVDSAWVEWPDNKVTILSTIKANQFIQLYQKDATTKQPLTAKKKKTIFKEIEVAGVDFVHSENDFVDFNNDRLLFNMISNEGPCVCAGDINQDGLRDFYIGGAKNQAGALFIQQASGRFSKSNEKLLETDRDSEDTDCQFFDANGDGRDDLYVTSGGSEFSTSSTALIDRLYLSQGNGQIKKSQQLLPIATSFESTSTIVANDFDLDGDLDLFVGARLIPSAYGLPASGYILRNDGKGNYSDVTKTVAPQLTDLGLITGAMWMDANNDSHADLLVVGEWMPIKLFINENGKLVDRSEEYGFHKTNGWYHSIAIGDFNKDGWMDVVVGNHGLNSRFKASEQEPVSLYINDFDANGSIEAITTRYDQGRPVPFVLKQDLVAQIPSLKKKFLHFKDYGNKTMEEIFTPAQLNGAVTLHAYNFHTTVWINTGKGSFTKRELPMEAQFFPVYAMLVDDFTRDGNLDILLGGNLNRAKPETGIYAAGYGLLLTGNKNGDFRASAASESGLAITGEIRKFAKISIKNKPAVLVAKNNDKVQILSY